MFGNQSEKKLTIIFHQPNVQAIGVRPSLTIHHISGGSWSSKKNVCPDDQLDILLMVEILHQLIGRLSHYLQGFIHPRWCKISAINSI